MEKILMDGVISENCAGAGTVKRRVLCMRAAAQQANIKPISNI
jgi:hypothetical protein